MNRLSQLRKLFSMPPGESLAKVRTKLREKRDDLRQSKHDQCHATYLAEGGIPSPPIASLIGPIDVALLLPHRETIIALSSRAIAHEFDLLGSGWTVVENTRGLEVTPANLSEATRIAKLLPEGYKPIDWHIDFKSGHHWDPRGWYRHQPQVVGWGIDVKVPWELSRMQHLPLLAWGFALAEDGADMPHTARAYRDEFRGELLDFIAHNPPRFGINWNCTMDVAIRAAGWAMTFDLFQSAGAEFDDAFTEVFTRSLHEHMNHIAANLEWDDNIRGNHYLADIAGLLILSAYLPADTMTDRYLRFAARELIAETLRQFHPDGSNFEASTSYHRLSAEMVVYALAVLQAVTPARLDALTANDWTPLRPGEPSPALPILKTTADTATVIPGAAIDRVARMGRFTQDILDRYDRDPQIGDNDNGRFFKLMPVAHYDTDGLLYEDPRNHRHLIDAVEGFFPSDLLREGEAPAEPQSPGNPRLGGSIALPIETSVICALLGGVTFEHPDLPAFTDHIAYPGMGLYLYKHGRMTTVVRCGEIGQNGHGGHAHDDQMSFVLYVGGEPVVIDPGTGCYTPDVGKRNLLRSAASHSTPRTPRQGALQWEDGIPGLFSARQTGYSHVIYHDETQLICEHNAFGSPYRREFRMLRDRITITDHTSIQVFMPGALCITAKATIDPSNMFSITIPDIGGLEVKHEGLRVLTATSTSYSSAYGKHEDNVWGVYLIANPQNANSVHYSISIAEDAP